MRDRLSRQTSHGPVDVVGRTLRALVEQHFQTGIPTRPLPLRAGIVLMQRMQAPLAFSLRAIAATGCLQPCACLLALTAAGYWTQTSSE